MAVDLALDILDLLELEADLNVTEVAQRLHVDKSTASRRLSELFKRNLVDRDPDSGRFRLGVRFLGLGRKVAERLSIRNVAFPIMAQLRDATNETVELTVRRGLERVYIEVVETSQPVRRVLPTGVPLPLYPGAPGKPFLAHMTARELAPIFDELESLRFAAGRVPDRATLEAELRAVRETGVAWGHEEMILGAGAVAFPLFDHGEKVAAALSISIPSPRFTPEHRQHCQEQGLAAAREISSRLGFPEPAQAATPLT